MRTVIRVERRLPGRANPAPAEAWARPTACFAHNLRMDAKRAIVRAVNTACTLVDEVAYRPAVVKLTMGLPRWWRCDLAKLSMRLDDLWGTGFWDESGPAVPGGVCEVCDRRAAIFTLFGHDDDEEPDDFLSLHPVNVCGWCHVRPRHLITDHEGLSRALAEARERSVRWSWRWRVDV